MDPFAKHKIEHLSPSSLNCYAEQPCFWVLKYLLGHCEEENAAMWRGSAVEAGIDQAVYQQEPEAILAAMEARFEEDAQGEITDEIERERGALGAFLDNAMEAMRERQWLSVPPVGRQIKVERWFDDIEVPIIGYADYEWENFGLDLKTTRRIPTVIPARHARQISLYSTARGKPYRLLYASEKRADVRELSTDEVKTHVQHLLWNAHNIRRALSLYEDPADLVRLFPPNFDHFFWKSDEGAKQKALEILDVK